MENIKDSVKAPKSKKRKIIIIILIVITVFAALLIALYIRVNPKWKAAELTIEPSEIKYNIKDTDPEGMTVQSRINPPEGYNRIKVGEGSFGEYLREYPVLPAGVKLPVYDGTTMSPFDAAAIFDISLGDEGYQQCADSIIRLYSDYYYEKGQYDKISFQFSNGDECSYQRWRDGKRMLVLGGFSMEIPMAFYDDSEQQYRNYLKEVMNYAGTISLQNESRVIPLEELRIGDFICSDTHVVMIVDIAENEKGEKCYKSYSIVLEKMLVDMCADKLISATFSKAELPDVFDQVQSRYRLDKAKMLRYARRRNKADEVKKYLK